MQANNSPLKILHILDHSLPLHSGYAFRSQNIFRAQNKRGWDPIALTSPKHEKSWKGHWGTKEEIGGFRYYRTGPLPHKTLPFQTEMQLMAALGKRIREVAETEKPHLLHAHSPVINAIPAFWVARKMGIPMVYEIRALWEDAATDHGTYSEKSCKYKLVRSADTWACHKADQVAVLCHGLRADFIRRGIPSTKIAVVPNGINLDDFNSCEPDKNSVRAWRLDGKKVIGFIGSFYRYEGLDLLVDAFAHLALTKPNLVLLLVGGGEVEAELKAQINHLQLEDRVIMPGRISHDRIPAVYALADILAYPRYSTRLTELVTPLKPLEAMAMSKAIVASDIGGHRELIQHGHTGLLFRTGDVSALAAALEILLSNNDLCRNLAKGGFSWVRQNRSWEHTTAVYSDIYLRSFGKTHNQLVSRKIESHERYFLI